MFWITLLLMVVAALFFLYRGAAYWSWVVAGGLGLLSWLAQGADPGFLFVPVAVLFIGVAVLFGVTSLRRDWVSKPLMKSVAPMMPNISETERAALDAGSVWWDGELFSGKPDWKRLLRFVPQPLTAKEQAFIDGPVEELCRMLDDWEISRSSDLPHEAWDFLKQKRFFGMIIPEEYGGLGFSARAHSEVVSKVSSRCLTAAVTVMVPNSLGPAELLMHYGTESQKRYYLPRLASGEEIPAFALTEPGAGSDAASGASHGVVSKGMFQGEECLGIRLNWDKRYITLVPIATVLGLAFKLQDPDHLLGEATDLGITCALIPTNIPGIDISKRHDPLGVPFLNGPTSGQDVFVPVDFVIGGREMAGQGWRMLMESLAAGRSISLPGLANGAAQVSARVAGAYATVREQFGLPIGRFEGIQEPLARIAGRAYMTDAARTLIAGAVDSGEKPAVLSAIVKAYLTEFMRQSVNDASDIQAGAMISQGPRNVLASAYRALPIGITVEGANILTRSLIIYGQGAIRCHPHVRNEIRSVQLRDVAAFDRAFWGHVGFVFVNAARAWFLGLTGGRFLAPPQSSELERHFGRLTRYSAAFTLLSDVAMLTLGAKLKRMESLSGRMADALAWMYMGSATLKRFIDEGERESDRAFAQWSLELAEHRIEAALNEVLNNFPNRLVALKMRAILFPWGVRARYPSDKRSAEVAMQLLDGREGRINLTRNMYLPGADDPALGRLEAALAKVVAAQPVEKKVAAAVRSHRIPKGDRLENAEAALKANLITAEELQLVREATEARDDAIQVDAFDSETFARPEMFDELEKVSS